MEKRSIMPSNFNSIDMTKKKPPNREARELFCQSKDVTLTAEGHLRGIIREVGVPSVEWSSLVKA